MIVIAIFVLINPTTSVANDALVVVRLTQDAYVQVDDIEAIHTIDYGSFVLLELTSSNFELLSGRGVEFERQRDPTVLNIQGYSIYTGEPPLMARTLASVSGMGFFIVQIIGPTKDEWLTELEDSGLEILQYIQHHAYLVRMPIQQTGEVEALDFVRWVGPYLQEYRIITILDDGRAGGTVDRTIEAIKALGGTLVEREVARASDPFVTVLFTMSAAAVQSAAQMDNVVWLNFRAPFYPDEDEMSDQIIAGNFNPLNAGYQNWLTNTGFDGTGVAVAALDRGYDTGVDATAHPDLSGRTIMVNDSGGIPTDQNGHGTHVGGIIAGNASLGTTDASGFLMGLGVAPGADLVVRHRTVDSDSDQTRDAVINGAVASNHSYALHGAGIGYTNRDRTYDILVRDADQTTANVAEPLIIVFSAGNSGASGPTKEPKNVIAVGSTRNQRDGNGNPGFGNIDTVSGSSSRGPAGDGRIYPHVAAPGGNVISTRYSAATSCATIAAGAPAADPTYSMCSGTSMAAPHVTGSLALITEWWRGFNAGANSSPAMAKALLVNGAEDMGTADIPNGDEGWGRINLSNVIDTGISTFYLDQTTVFASTGNTWSANFIPANTSQPVKVTLAWSDAPGPGTGGNPAALVNDLDLVVDESGTIYRGNVFANGFSVTGGAADSIDNLENVFIQNPTGNTFTVTITASGINGDGVPYNGDSTDQDFALVVQNGLEVAIINVVKEVDAQPDGVFDDDPSGWTFDVDDDGEPTQTTDNTGMLTFPVVPDTYDVEETAGPTGLWLVTASCVDDDTGAPVGTGATEVEFESPGNVGVTGLNLSAQQSITCTFKNKADQAFVNIIKTVDAQPDGVFDDDPSGWTFDVDDDGEPTQTTDNTGMLTFVVRPDTYDVEETAGPTGLWLVTASCVDDDTGVPVGTGITDQLFGLTLPEAGVTDLDLVAGQSVSCTFDNQKMAGFITGGGKIDTGRGRNAKSITFGGNLGVALDGSFYGQLQTNFHNVGNGNVSGNNFHSTSISSVVFGKNAGEPPDPPTAVFNSINYVVTGRFDGQTCTLEAYATDHGEPARGKNAGADSDSIRFILDCTDAVFDYDSYTDFAEEEPIGLHNLDGGNLQIHPPKE
jgi:hypothetical protein